QSVSAPVAAGEGVGQLGLADDDDAVVGDDEAAAAVLVEVVADARVGRDLDVLVDDGPADAAVSADVHAVEQDRVLDHGEAVDAHVGRQDALADVSAAEDAALADHAVVRLAAADVAAVPLFVEDELRRRQLRLVGADRPLAVVQVQHRVDADQVHVGLVVGLQGADVAPVRLLLAVAVAAAAGEDAVRPQAAGDGVAADVVAASVGGGVGGYQLVHEPGREDVDAQRGQAARRVVGQRRRGLRLLDEAGDAGLPVHVHDAEAGRVLDRGDDAADGQVGV